MDGNERVSIGYENMMLVVARNWSDTGELE